MLRVWAPKNYGVMRGFRQSAFTANSVLKKQTRGLGAMGLTLSLWSYNLIINFRLNS